MTGNVSAHYTHNVCSVWITFAARISRWIAVKCVPLGLIETNDPRGEFSRHQCDEKAWQIMRAINRPYFDRTGFCATVKNTIPFLPRSSVYSASKMSSEIIINDSLCSTDDPHTHSPAHSRQIPWQGDVLRTYWPCYVLRESGWPGLQLHFWQSMPYSIINISFLAVNAETPNFQSKHFLPDALQNIKFSSNRCNGFYHCAYYDAIARKKLFIESGRKWEIYGITIYHQKINNTNKHKEQSIL